MLQNSSDLYNGNIARMVTTITDPNSRAVLPLGNAYQYDQLNRLKHAVSFDQLNGNAWAGGAPAKYQNSFTYDANGNILTQTRKDDNNQVIDELAYFYPQNAANKTVRNRLLYVSDNVDYDASDIDPGMSTNNYEYDAEGRLIKDLQEGIDEIKWRVDGKVKSIKQSDNKPGEYSLSFDYDAMGHRIAKHSYDKNQAYNNGLGQLVKSTYYVLDAQGNTMATYERAVDENTLQISFAQTEKFIYGSARLGVQNVNIGLLGSQNNTYSQTTVPHRIGKKGYELSNHLGNVLSVISDKVIPHSNGTIVDYWQADILQSTDYSPFGVTLEGRKLKKTGLSDKFRFGFQNQEMDDEIKGEGNSVNFEYRMHDPRLGRFFAIDPLVKQYSYNSPYSFSENTLIDHVELEGKEKEEVNKREPSPFELCPVHDSGKVKKRHPIIKKVSYTVVKRSTSSSTPTGIMNDATYTDQKYFRNGFIIDWNAYPNADLLVVTDENGNQVFNSGWTPGTQQATVNGTGLYTINVTRAQNTDPTGYDIQFTEGAQKIVTHEKYYLFGFILIRSNKKVHFRNTLNSSELPAERSDKVKEWTTNKPIQRVNRRNTGKQWKRESKKERKVT